MAKKICTLIITLLCAGCMPGDPPGGDYPDFITENDDYFVTHIGPVPVIDAGTYELSVYGLVDTPASFSLDELMALNLVEFPLTTECIGNWPNGRLVGTAYWKGFSLYEFLVSLGLDESATGIKYYAADGYYASHTLEQLQENGAVGALYMNGEELPAVQGFPLRIIVPGLYGAKQPAWVTEIEVIDTPLEDYWQDRGWDLTPPMDVDSMIFFPVSGTAAAPGQTLEVGGAAFGGTRIESVAVSTDNGSTWQSCEIVKRLDEDHVWVFWKTEIVFDSAGSYTVYCRATDMYGTVQPRYDSELKDGINIWPAVTVQVTQQSFPPAGD